MELSHKPPELKENSPDGGIHSEIPAGRFVIPEYQKYTPVTGGKWNGERGNSVFFPSLNAVPKEETQKNELYAVPKTWKEILEGNRDFVRNNSAIPPERRDLLVEEYAKLADGRTGIRYIKQGDDRSEPDFSNIAYDTVTVSSAGATRIPEWRYARDDPDSLGRPGVMDLGDLALAGKWGWSKEQVREYISGNLLTWHERLDGRTLDLVPRDVHLIPHRGGHSELANKSFKSAMEVNYLGDARDINGDDLRNAQEMVLEASVFIKENAGTEIELKVAAVLEKMLREGKVYLCNSEEECGWQVFGFFSSEEVHICLDLEIALDYGKSELIDTLFHEAYHAAQYEAGHTNDMLAEENRAWNLGLDMKNRYLVQNESEPSRTAPYTEWELFFMGYSHSLGRNVFTEIC
jgi:hypothetical protein